MPAPARVFQTRRLADAGLALLFLVSATYRARDAVDRVAELLHGTEIVRDPFGVDGATLTITRLQPEAEQGLAIGDVSGKGIPAALLMATLRAYLRGQAVHTQADLAQVMVNLNKLVYESSASNRYATFFYGQYDSATRVLHYVNGGHNAPMVFRAVSGEVMRLDTGGPVIGLITGCEYEQARVTLEPGDVLVAYTDGVSEAMNGDHDEWGEENLMDTVRPNRALPSRELIDRIMARADAFVAGAPQHDDMTIVVARLV